MPKHEGLRSPYDKKVGGLYHLGRMLDKIRLHQAGCLPENLRENYGLSMGLDGHLYSFLGSEFKDLEERIAQGGTDEEIAEWIFARGLRPNRMQTRIWNECSRKFGWNDFITKYLEKYKAEAGHADRTDILTSFDAIVADEGHELPR